MAKAKKPRTIFSIIGFALTALVLLTSPLLTLIVRITKNTAPQVAGFITEYSTLSILARYALFYGIGFLVFWLIARNAPKVTVGRKEEFGFGRFFGAFAVAYMLGISGNAVGSIITLITGRGLIVAESLNNMTQDGALLPGLILVIVAPVVEELIFRKIIIDRTKRFGEKTAIIFSALAFGLFHMNLTQLIFAFAVGLVFAYVYSRSQNILYTMIMHSLINGISYIGTLVSKPVLDSMSQIDLNSLSDLAGLNGSAGWMSNIDVPSVLGMMAFNMVATFLIVFGFVTFFRKAIRVRFDYSSPELLAGNKVFGTVYINPGVIVFVLVSLAWIVMLLVRG